MTKLILSGTAGQGIKLLGYVLANLLKDQNYQVALTFEYDAFVRTGKSTACLVFSKEKIDNPLVDKADLQYDLNEKKLQENLLKKFNNSAILNMVLLGTILKRLNLEIAETEIKKYLPKKNLKENLQAIRQGYPPSQKAAAR